MKQKRRVDWNAVKQLLGDLREVNAGVAGGRTLQSGSPVFDEDSDLMEDDHAGIDSPSEDDDDSYRNPYGWSDEDTEVELEWWEEEFEDEAL